MWPIGHLAVGYLSYVITVARTRRAPPIDWRVLVVIAVGTQLPDLVDKPLSYWGLLSSGRSVAHSLVVFGTVAAGLRLLVAFVRDRRSDSTVWHAFSRYRLPLAVGYLSHLAADSYGSVLAGELWSVRYLAWPVLPAPLYSGDESAPWNRLLDMTLTPAVKGELLLATVAVLVFVWLRIRDR